MTLRSQRLPVMLGILLGILTWFFFDQLWALPELIYPVPVATTPGERLLFAVVDLAPWAIPAALLAAFVAIRSGRIVQAALAVTLFWFMANITYYLLYALKIILGFGNDQLGVTLGNGISAWWDAVKALRLQQMIGRDFVVWTGLGLVGGPIVGSLIGVIALGIWRKARPRGVTSSHRRPC